MNAELIAHFFLTTPPYRTIKPGMLWKPTKVAAANCQALFPVSNQAGEGTSAIMASCYFLLYRQHDCPEPVVPPYRCERTDELNVAPEICFRNNHGIHQPCCASGLDALRDRSNYHRTHQLCTGKLSADRKWDRSRSIAGSTVGRTCADCYRLTGIRSSRK